MKKFVLLLMYGILLYYTLSYLYRQPVDKDSNNNTLIIGTSADYPPYAFIDLHSSEIIGFDIDIVKEIAHRLGKKCIIKDMPFNTLIFELIYGQIDLIAAGLSPDDRRAKKVLFSRSYLDSDPLIIITKKSTNPITKVTDLHGKLTAVNIGYTSDIYLTKDYAMKLVRLDTPADAIMALQSGSVYAFVCAQSSLSSYLVTKKDHDFQFFTIPTTSDSYALALSKQNKNLQEYVDMALFDMEKDGTLKKLKEKWSI